jgi:hypothetical protein
MTDTLETIRKDLDSVMHENYELSKKIDALVEKVSAHLGASSCQGDCPHLKTRK